MRSNWLHYMLISNKQTDVRPSVRHSGVLLKIFFSVCSQGLLQALLYAFASIWSVGNILVQINQDVRMEYVDLVV